MHSTGLAGAFCGGPGGPRTLLAVRLNGGLDPQSSASGLGPGGRPGPGMWP